MKKSLILCLFMLFASSLNAQISSENCGNCNDQGSGGHSSGGAPKHPNSGGGNHKKKENKEKDFGDHYEPPKEPEITADKRIQMRRRVEIYKDQKALADHIIPRTKHAIATKPEFEEKREVRLGYMEIAERANNAIIKVMSSDDQQAAKVARNIVDIAMDMAVYLESDLMSELLETAIDFSPASWAKDLYEGILGKSLITGKELDHFSRTTAIIGTLTAGFGSKALKAVSVMHNMAWTDKALSNVVESASQIFNGKPLYELKNQLNFFKKHGVITETTQREVKIEKITDFLTGSKVKVLSEDVKVYRYYTETKNEARANWMTSYMTDKPQQDLALKYPPKDMKEWIIPKGTEVMHGTVAPKYNQPGGGDQYYVPNPEVLREP